MAHFEIETVTEFILALFHLAKVRGMVPMARWAGPQGILQTLASRPETSLRYYFRNSERIVYDVRGCGEVGSELATLLNMVAALHIVGVADCSFLIC